MSSSSVASSEVEVPYAMNFSSDEDKKKKKRRRNSNDSDSSSDSSGIFFQSPQRQQQIEPLRVGDVISYVSPVYTAGSNHGQRQAKVLAVDPNAPQFPLTLDTCEFLDWDHPIRRTGEFYKGKVYPHKGRPKPLSSFSLLASSTSSTTALQSAIQLKAQTVRGAMQQLEAHAVQAYAGNTTTTKQGIFPVATSETSRQRRRRRRSKEQEEARSRRKQSGAAASVSRTTGGAGTLPQKISSRNNNNNNKSRKPKPLAEPSSSSSSSSSSVAMIESSDDDSDFLGLRTQPTMAPTKKRKATTTTTTRPAELARGSKTSLTGSKQQQQKSTSLPSSRGRRLDRNNRRSRDDASIDVPSSSKKKNTTTVFLEDTDEEGGNVLVVQEARRVLRNQTTATEDEGPLSAPSSHNDDDDDDDDDFLASQKIPFYKRDFIPEGEKLYGAKKKQKLLASSGGLSFSKSNSGSAPAAKLPSPASSSFTSLVAVATKNTNDQKQRGDSVSKDSAASRKDQADKNPSTRCSSFQEVAEVTINTYDDNRSKKKAAPACTKVKERLTSNSYLSCDASSSDDKPVSTTPKVLDLTVKNTSLNKGSGASSSRQISSKHKTTVCGGEESRLTALSDDCRVPSAVPQRSKPMTLDAKLGLEDDDDHDEDGAPIKQSTCSVVTSKKPTLDAALGLDDDDENVSSQEFSAVFAKNKNPTTKAVNGLPPSSRARKHVHQHLDESSEEDDDDVSPGKHSRSSNQQHMNPSSGAKRKRQEWLDKQRRNRPVAMEESPAKRRRTSGGRGLVDQHDESSSVRRGGDPSSNAIRPCGDTVRLVSKPKRPTTAQAKESLYEEILNGSGDDDDEELLMRSKAFCGTLSGLGARGKENSQDTTNGTDGSQESRAGRDLEKHTRRVVDIAANNTNRRLVPRGSDHSKDLGKPAASGVKSTRRRGEGRRRLITSTKSVLETVAGASVRRGLDPKRSNTTRRLQKPTSDELSLDSMKSPATPLDIYGNSKGKQAFQLSDTSSSGSEDEGTMSRRGRPRKRASKKGKIPSSWSSDCDVDSPSPSPCRNAIKKASRRPQPARHRKDVTEPITSPVFDFVDEVTPKNKKKRRVVLS